MKINGPVLSEFFQDYLEHYFAGYETVMFIGPTSSARPHLNDMTMRDFGPLYDWFAANVEGEWRCTERYVAFKNENDAFAFKMRWL